jgi:hypothetical protein
MYSLVAALLLTTIPAPAPFVQSGGSPAAQAPQSASGLVLADDVEGHVLVYDSRQQLVFEMDKEARRPVRMGVGPGQYVVRLESSRSALRITVEVRDGEFTIVDRSRFDKPAADEARPARSEPASRAPQKAETRQRTGHEPPSGPLKDAANRIEVRFAVWPAPSFSYAEPQPVRDVQHSSLVDMGLGVEYLRSVSVDLAIGVAVSTRTLTSRKWTGDDRDDGTRSTDASTFVPAVIRWNFARRLTPWRVLDPYVTGSVGPLFRTSRVSFGYDDDSNHWSDGTTSLGGRLGAGVDAHLGRVFTLGVVGAWNWSDRPDTTVGYGPHDQGGEVSVTMGWEWGRPGHTKR